MWAMANRALVPPTSPTSMGLAQLTVIESPPASGVYGPVDDVRIRRPVGVAVGRRRRGEAHAGAFLGRAYHLAERREQLAAEAPRRAAGVRLAAAGGGPRLQVADADGGQHAQ